VRDRHSHHRVAARVAEPDESRTDDNPEGDEAVDAGMVPVGDESGACEPSPCAIADEPPLRAAPPRGRRT
jgi:hypothetical protein